MNVRTNQLFSRPSARRAGTRRRQRGIALMVCIFALLLLSGIAMGLMFMADTETIINENYRASQQAFMAATAGIEEVRERLMSTSTNPIAAPIVMPGLPGGVVYVRNPRPGETVDPADPSNAFFDSQLCKENFTLLGLTNPGGSEGCASTAPTALNWNTYVASSANYANAGLSYKWVRLTLKANNTRSPYCVNGNCAADSDRQVCWNGDRQVLLPAGWLHCGQEPPIGQDYLRPVYILTSLAVTPQMANRAGARRWGQMEVAFHPPFLTNAAVDSQDNVVLSGNLFINGYDNCSCQCVTTGSGSNRTTTCTDRLGKICDGSRWAIYSAGEVDAPNPSQTLVSGQDPDVAENQPWDYDIPALIERYRDMGGTVDVRNAPYNWSCTGSPGSMNCGTQSGQVFGVPPYFPPDPPDNPAGPSNMSTQITYVPGNLQMTANTQGNGILVIDGDLDINGGLNFYGLVLVRGVIRFTGGGSQATNIYGAILAGEQSLVDTRLGGSASIFYDKCSLTRDFGKAPPTRLAFREVVN